MDKDSKLYIDAMEDTLSEHEYLQRELNLAKIKFLFYGILIMVGAVIVFFNSYGLTKYVCADGKTVDSSDLCLYSNLQNSTATDSFSDTCYDFIEAKNHIGEISCIKGKVVQVFTSSKGNNFLNFCSNYKTCTFSAVIFSSDANKFEDVKIYSRENVEITGLVKSYKGNAEIIVKTPDQIRIT